MSVYVKVGKTKEKASPRPAPKAVPAKGLTQLAQMKAAKLATLQLLREQAGKQAALQLFREQAQLGQVLRGAEVVQRQDVGDEEENLLQGKFETVQRVVEDEVDADVQMQRENRTGMPDGLKAGVESLSGLSMDEVRVHYNSSMPAKVQALAYTQGTNIHVAPGQERHLPHEAWHVVQQAQGRVQPTMQLQELGGVGVNDDAGLEREANVMGSESLRIQFRKALLPEPENNLGRGICPSVPVNRSNIIQMVRDYPPLSNGAVINMAEALATRANLFSGQPPFNTNVDPNYVTADQSISLKQSWREKPAMQIGLTNFNRRASDSSSGAFVDLKLASTEGDSEFNCHVAIDHQKINPQPPPKEDTMRTMKSLYQKEKGRPWPYS